MKPAPRIRALCLRRVALLCFAGALLVFLPASDSFCRVPPPPGTYKGVYHKNRAGVATLSREEASSSFLVDKNLTAQLDRYEGKNIEIEVTKVGGPMITVSNIFVIRGIGKVKELEQPPLEIKIQPIPRITDKPQPVDEKKVKDLLKQLDAEDFETRESAHKQIISMGEGVVPLIKQFRRDPSTEVRSRIDKIIEFFDGKPRTFDIVVYVKNVGKEPARNWCITLWDCRYREAPAYSGAERYAAFFSERELSFGPDLEDDWPTIRLLWSGYAHPSQNPASRTRIMPGETVPLLWPGEVLSPGEHEILVGIDKIEGEKRKLAAYASCRLDVNTDVPAMPVPPESPLKVEAGVEKQDKGWIHIGGKISNPTGKEYSACLLNNGRGVAGVGMIQALDKDGRNVPIRLSYDSSSGNPWEVKKIDKDGFTISCQVQHNTLFPDRPIKTLVAWVISGNEAQPLVLLDNIEDKTAIQPVPWGKKVNGIKCRIRMQSETIKKGGPAQFCLQLVSDKSPQAFCLGSSDKKQAVGVVVDGTVVNRNLPRLGWKRASTMPYEATLSLPPSLNLSRGKHTLQISFDTKRTCDKEGAHVVSNTVEFEIEE